MDWKDKVEAIVAITMMIICILTWIRIFMAPETITAKDVLSLVNAYGIIILDKVYFSD